MELVLYWDVVLSADFDFLSNRHVSGHELPATLKEKRGRAEVLLPLIVNLVVVLFKVSVHKETMVLQVSCLLIIIMCCSGTRQHVSPLSYCFLGVSKGSLQILPHPFFLFLPLFPQLLFSLPAIKL